MPLLVARAFGDRFHDAVEIEAAGLLARRKLTEALQPLADIWPPLNLGSTWYGLASNAATMCAYCHCAILANGIAEI